MYIPSKYKKIFVGLVLLLSMFASSSYAFNKTETQKLMATCIANTQQQYGYSTQLSRAYCRCGVSRNIAYMKKHNLKEGVKPTPPDTAKSIAQDLINISEKCARETLTR